MGGTPVEIDYAPFRDAAGAALQRAVGRRAHGRGRRVHRRRRRRRPTSGRRRARSSWRGRDVQRRRCLRGPVRAGRAFKARAEAEMARTSTSSRCRPRGTIYRVADLEREPMLYNSHLGHYTNFVNFFGLARPGAAGRLPARRHAVRHHPDRPGRMPNARCSPSARAGSARWRCRSARPRASCRHADSDPVVAEDRVSIAVVGAHMSGLPLNGQLTELGGRLESAGRPRRSIASTPCPAVRRSGPAWCASAKDGGAIELEVWSLPAAAGRQLPAQDPRAAGAGHRHPGRRLGACRASCAKATRPTGARDITALGGWRAYLKTLPV